MSSSFFSFFAIKIHKLDLSLVPLSTHVIMENDDDDDADDDNDNDAGACCLQAWTDIRG